ncbi:MAG: RDD family protein [Alphaproteobacteria bacterium]|nr:RDD family protein [Alphaproteobacteria bacterium]
MDVRYAGFWRRTGAIMIDSILFIIIYFGIDMVLGDNFFYASVLYQALCAIYYIGLTASPMQATLGQKLLSVKIGTLTGEGINVLQSLFRYFMWVLPAWPLIVYTSLPSTGDITTKMTGFDLTTDEAGAALDFMNSPEVQSFMMVNGILTMIAAVGGIIWCISIAVSEQKAGIHDLVCKQRAFRA